MFTIQKWRIDVEENAVHFPFVCHTYGAFCEIIAFPETAFLSAYCDDETLHRLLDVMAAYLGVSYYKLAAADKISFEPSFSDVAKASIEKLYTNGLGEFYIRNELEYPPKIDFSYQGQGEITSHFVREENLRAVKSTGATVAFGGGKDSHVSISLFDKLGIEQDLVSVVLAKSVQETLRRLSYKDITFIERKIDSKLIDLVKAGKGYNGHVPITAINSIILSVYSYLVGHNWVVFSNERGASVPTMHHGAHEVNHQYSKSLEFEGLFRNTLNDICGEQVQYFSLLRAFSELWIAEKLGREALTAHDCFSSCNRNFVFEGADKLAKGKRWCGECSKCVYTALIVAPHISKKEFLNIFGGNILDDESNIQIAKNLCGIGEAKPWECVGDFVDTAASLYRLAFQDEWRGDTIPKELAQELADKYGAEFLKKRVASEIASRGDHFLPDQIVQIV